MSSKHLPRLFAQALNEKQIELFDEFIHLEYNNHNVRGTSNSITRAALHSRPRQRVSAQRFVIQAGCDRAERRLVGFRPTERRAVPSAPGVGRTRHPRMGAAEQPSVAV
jgi:hypothetical protein